MFCSYWQVEKLIKDLPSVPVEWSNGYANSAVKDHHLSNGISINYSENGMGLRETQSMLLERIASEMNRLKFYIAHAQVNFAHFLVTCTFSSSACLFILGQCLVISFWKFICLSDLFSL